MEAEHKHKICFLIQTSMVQVEGIGKDIAMGLETVCNISMTVVEPWRPSGNQNGNEKR